MRQKDAEQKNDVAKTLDIGAGRSRWRHLRRGLFWIALLAALGLAAQYWLKPAPASAIHYTTEEVQHGDIVVTVTATGTLEPVKTVEVGIEVSGTIESVEVDFNDHVVQDQVLARIDTSKIEAQVLQSQAALESARAMLLQAQATAQEAQAQMGRLDAVHTLSEGKLPSQYEFDAQKAVLARAHADEANTKAAVAQAQATLDAIRSDLAKAEVRSPIDGVVLDRAIEPGQTVAAQFQSPVLFTLAEDLTQIKLEVDVDEADVGQVHEGQEASFTVDAYPDRVFPARTTQVRYASQTVEGVVTYTAVLDVQNPTLELRPGMTATALITVDKREDALLVPNAALRFRPPEVDSQGLSGQGGILGMLLPRPPGTRQMQPANGNEKSKDQQVYVLENGQLAAVAVTRGLSDGVRTEIVKGALKPGMQLVTDLLTEKS